MMIKVKVISSRSLAVTRAINCWDR